MSAFNAYIFNEDNIRLTEDSARSHCEGGSLFGQWTSTGNPVVHVAFSSRLPKRHGATKYLYDSYRMCHIGEWRAVPYSTGTSYNYSSDSRAREDLLSKYSGQQATPARFLVLDVNRSKIDPFLFEKRIFKGMGTLEILSGENPFNRMLMNPQYQQPEAAGQVQRDPGYYRSQSNEARTTTRQWYSGDIGNNNLQQVYQQFQNVARFNKVEMSRNTQSQDIEMSFTDNQGKQWAVNFPANFPYEGAVLIDKSQAGMTSCASGYPRTNYEQSFGYGRGYGPVEKKMPSSNDLEKGVKSIISCIKAGRISK